MHRSITGKQKMPDTQREQIDSNSELKKPKSVKGFELGQLRQNGIAQPLVPQPLPNEIFYFLL